MAVSVIEDIIDHIEATTSGLTLVGGFLPESPDTVIAVMAPEPGEKNIDVLGTSIGTITLEKPILQIRSRAARNQFLVANNNAWTVYRAINNTVNSTIGVDSTRYLLIEAMETPYTLGADANERWIIGFTIQIWKEPNV